MADPGSLDTTPVDVSTLDAAQRYELHRRLTRAGISFQQRRDQLDVPSAKVSWVVEMLADLEMAAEADDRGAPSGPFARAEIPGVGTPASRRRRLGGWLIDETVWVAAIRVISVAAPWVVSWAVIGVGQVAMVRLLGATPGKLAVGIQVRRRDGSGRPDWGRSAARWGLPGTAWAFVRLSPVAGLVVLGLSLVSAALVLFHPEGQALHDLVADTVVVADDGTGGRRR